MKLHLEAASAVRTIGVLVLVATAALAFSAPASAANFGSRITIRTTLPLYHGKVHSPRQSFCEESRRVVLFQKVKGADVKVGKTLTNRKGKWKVKVPSAALTPGEKFYALVRKDDLGNQIVCNKAKSDKVTFIGG